VDDRQAQTTTDEYASLIEKMHFLEESNSALVVIQDKLERLSCFHSEMVLSYDIQHILGKGLAKFQEIVETKVCSVFLVDEQGFEFIHKVSIPEELSSTVQREIDAQIKSGTFGSMISSGNPVCIPTEVFIGEGNQSLRIIIAPLSHKERTIGVVVIIFEEDQDFISYFDIIRAIANSVEARDPYTKGHSNRVGQIARAVAKELDWSDDEIKLIDWGGMLHDVGKIGINDAILNKPGKLNEEEYKAIKLHPSIGAKIVKGISFLEPVAPYILEHHERFDGKGYPQGLAGENISIKGRVLAVADVFDAVTTDRTYHKALDPEVAFKEIIAKNALSQFDPKIVDALERAWRSGKIE